MKYNAKAKNMIDAAPFTSFMKGEFMKLRKVTVRPPSEPS